ncbi:hypothetical protein EDC02_2217 [Micromonospora sp. Llam0]|uniref:hypothetical protein n=1 Tax=Micromonospora sp. Llam0 TaxID=2485143 RepID=UPI000FACDC8A|nr:hypothetical protein [Micromonospora sp. Llam0]ROO60354.1 hypothetical protein EDC02_2217 [Micromonospora sp. Llam0]
MRMADRRHQPEPATTQPPDSHGNTDDDALTALIASVTADVTGTADMMDWAEDEIAKAARRHPDQADALYHAFSLIRPRDIGPGMTSEFVYRSHAAELLERIATAADTRPATAAELCLVCSQVSQFTPMHGAAAGLYVRLWQTAFPHHPSSPDMADQQVHYEKLFGSRIDDLEQELRRKCADANRRPTAIDCAGTHHGQRVACRYATAPTEGNHSRNRGPSSRHGTDVPTQPPGTTGPATSSAPAPDAP